MQAFGYSSVFVSVVAAVLVVIALSRAFGVAAIDTSEMIQPYQKTGLSAYEAVQVLSRQLGVNPDDQIELDSNP